MKFETKTNNMGQAKKLWMSYESTLSMLDDIISLLSIKYIENYIDNNVLVNLVDLRDTISDLDSISLTDMQLIVDSFSDEFRDFVSQLENIISSINSEEELNPILLNETNNLTRKLLTETRKIKNDLIPYVYNKQEAIYNSEKYYHEQIEELEKQKIELQNFLAYQKDIEGKSKEEIEHHKKSIKEKEVALLKANEQIKQYQKELEEKKKKENVIIEWDSKIKSTFDELTEYLLPIKKEHNRLTITFWIYTSLTTLIITSIFLLEVYVFHKLHASPEFPKWENYLAAIVPIPVFGGLLWAFIIQLNRTQRQLLILAKHIHEIRYVEGLLLSINSLSPDINNSTKRVNQAIDRLLENHLNASSATGSINEEKILNEENKDTIPIDIVLKLLKETKDIIKR